MHIRIIYYKGKNDATFLRTLGFAKGFVSNGSDVRFTFLLPPEDNWHLDSSDNIVQENIFESCPSFFKRCRFAIYLYSICKTLFTLKRDELLFFTLPYFNVLLALASKAKKVHYFMEFTEYPYYKIVPGVLRYIQSTSQLIAAKYADFVCVISNGLREYYTKKGISRICVVNMFVDTKRFTSLNSELSIVNPELISYCGSVSNLKDGVDILIKSFHIVHQSHPFARLRIIGTASQELMNSLKELTLNLGIEDYVEFTGRVSYDSMPSLLYQSGILALARPSSIQAQYGFPTKLGEYLCTSRPVVVTRTGEIDHFLKDVDSCVFARPDDIEDFATKLNWCIENYQEATKIGRNGLKVALDCFSAENETKKVIDFSQMMGIDCN